MPKCSSGGKTHTWDLPPLKLKKYFQTDIALKEDESSESRRLTRNTSNVHADKLGAGSPVKEKTDLAGEITKLRLTILVLQRQYDGTLESLINVSIRLFFLSRYAH